MKTYQVKMITYWTDNGDGSSTISYYNSKEELRKELVYAYGWDEDRWESLLSGEDSYENGAIDTTTIKVMIDDEDNVAIAPFSSYSGNQ